MYYPEFLHDFRPSYATYIFLGTSVPNTYSLN